MRGMKKIIQEAASLPVEERAIVVDSLPRTLNPPDAEIEREWMKVAKRRLAELRSGRVKAIPGEEVFAKIRERFEKSPSHFILKQKTNLTKLLNTTRILSLDWVTIFPVRCLLPSETLSITRLCGRL